MTPDPWGRDQLPSAVDDAADVMCKYEQQLEFNFKPNEATPEQIEQWQETELNWWADRQLGFVAIATIIQLSALGIMGLVMLLNHIVFK